MDDGILKLIVARKSQLADDIVLFELRSPSGDDLPPFTAGSHITVTAPSGQKRRYSLCNSPQERNRYVIAVKREDTGRGGSLSMTTKLSEGDEIESDRPANEFEMSASEHRKNIFIAGGIGITPIRAMILDCLEHGYNFQLYYLTRSPATTAFFDELSAPNLVDKVVIHHDNGDPNQAYDLWPILEQQHGAHLHCCGPRGLMDAVRDMTGHWSNGAVHFEDFVGAMSNRPEDQPFTVKLARSGKTYEVPARTSILDTLRSYGYALASSCESGTCGTCRTRWLEGQPDHRDLVLSEAERKREVMICVSRAHSSQLVLDI